MRTEIGQKRSSTRTRGEDDENLKQVTYSPKTSLNKISTQKNKTVLYDSTNKRVHTVLKEMGKRGDEKKQRVEMEKPASTRQTRSNSKVAVVPETCEESKKKTLLTKISKDTQLDTDTEVATTKNPTKKGKSLRQTKQDSATIPLQKCTETAEVTFSSEIFFESV